jgi:Flp pilus assembly protein TadD
MEKFQKAIDEYTRAIAINPKDADAFYNRGVAKTMVGDRTGAQQDWRKAAELGHAKAKELVGSR